MKKFEIIFMDGYDEVRNAETQEVIFSTILSDKLNSILGRSRIEDEVVDNVISIWNQTGTAGGNLWSTGKLDEYLLNEGRCTQEERELITESLYEHSKN